MVMSQTKVRYIHTKNIININVSGCVLEYIILSCVILFIMSFFAFYIDIDLYVEL